MSNSVSIFPKGDPDVIKLVEKFGGWQRVLDPKFDPPEELYEGFEAAGYPRYKMRATEGLPERDAWMQTIARCLYGWWFTSYLEQKRCPERRKYWPCPGFPGLTSGVRWQDYPQWKQCREETFKDATLQQSFKYTMLHTYKDAMTKLIISDEDIDDWIESHPEEFPNLGSR